MTRFVDVACLSKLVNHIGVESFLSGMADTIEEDFKRWSAFEKSARAANHCDVGVVELMPISNQKKYGFKFVNGHPTNPEKGLSTVMAFGALADMETGYPTLISELTLATAFRTAATSALAAKALARETSKVLGMIGCGAQSEFQALAFEHLLGIKELRIYDIDKNAMLKLQSNLSKVSNLNVILSDSARSATKNADIISTCTADKKWATVLTADMVAPGTHINAIGGDCPGKTELERALLEKAKIVIEYEPQTRIEGEIQQLEPGSPVTELWKILSGKEMGRKNQNEITIFDSVGFALEDFSALRFIQSQAEKSNMGEIIELIPELKDPKNLFNQVLSSNNKSTTEKAA